MTWADLNVNSPKWNETAWVVSKNCGPVSPTVEADIRLKVHPHLVFNQVLPNPLQEGLLRAGNVIAAGETTMSRTETSLCCSISLEQETVT